MKRVTEFELGPRGEWRVITLVVAPLLGVPGVFFGVAFVEAIQHVVLQDSGLTALGYAIALAPGVVSIACLGTVLLRLLGKPSLWLACVSVVLILVSFFFWPVVMLVVITAVLLSVRWQTVLAVVVGAVAVVAVMTAIMGWRWLRRRE